MARRFFLTNRLVVAFLLLQLLSAGISAATSTIDCHCFRDRSFSPENPTAFDPYLLATVQNRLLAHSMQLPRKEIVREKMSGVSGDHLWIAHQIARATTATPRQVMAKYAKEKSWPAVARQLDTDPEQLGSHFVAALPGDDSRKLAWAVVRQVLERGLGIPGQDITELASKRASLKEVVLASLLAKVKGDNPLDLFARARRNGNWGSVSIAEGVAIESIEAFLSKEFSSTAQ